MQILFKRGILKTLAIVLVAIILLYHLYSGTTGSFKTESVIAYSYDGGFEVSGVVLRGETPIESTAGGTFCFITGSGERVAKGGVIANIYADESGAAATARIAEIDKQISSLKKAQSYNNYNASDLDVLNKNISNHLVSLLASAQSGCLAGTEEHEVALTDALNRKLVITGMAQDYSALIASLTAEMQSLEAAAANITGTITAADSGYFIAGTDGYEGAILLDDLSAITPEVIENLKPTEQSGNYIGKLVSDYKWYIASLIPLDKAISMQEGDSVRLALNLKNETILNAHIEKINRADSGENAAVIFSCENMNKELAEMRDVSFKIITESYSGLRVNSKAIRIKDGVKGVYALIGQEICFREIKILYSSDSFVICEKQTSGQNRLKLYDEVVIKGKNLYDGKIIS